MPIKSFDVPFLSATRAACVSTCDNTEIPAIILWLASGHWTAYVRAASVHSTATDTTNPRNHHPAITPTSPIPQLQLTPSFAPAATPCELHPTSAHPPRSIAHHRECCVPVRLTLFPPERMVHA